MSVSCNFLAFLVKMKDSMWREVFVSASLILTRLKRTLDLLVSFNQKNVRHFFPDYLASGKVTKCKYNNRFFVRCFLTADYREILKLS